MTLINKATVEQINAALINNRIATSTTAPPDYTSKVSKSTTNEDLELLLGSGIHSLYLSILEKNLRSNFIDVVILKKQGRDSSGAIVQNNPYTSQYRSLQLDPSLSWQWSTAFQNNITNGTVSDGYIYVYDDFAHAWHGDQEYTSYNQTVLNLTVPLDIYVYNYVSQGVTLIGINAIDTNYYIKWRETGTSSWSDPIELVAKSTEPSTFSQGEGANIGGNNGFVNYDPNGGITIAGDQIIIDGEHVYLLNGVWIFQALNGTQPPVMIVNDNTKSVYINGDLYVQPNVVDFGNTKASQSNDIATAFTKLYFTVE